MTIRRGLTLIELMVTISILGLVVVVVGNLFISSTQLGNDEQARIDVGENASRVLGPLDEILRQGKEVLASAVIDGVTYTSNATTLVFSLPSLDNNNAPIAGTSDIGVIFYDNSIAANHAIRLIISPASGTFRQSQNSNVVDQAKDVYFRYTADNAVNSQAVTVTVQVTKNLRTQVYTRSNIIYAVFRNHP